MTVFVLIAAVLIITALSYNLGRSYALGQAGGHSKALHSRPGYYGTFSALWVAVPALFLLGIWLAAEGTIVTNLVVSGMGLWKRRKFWLTGANWSPKRVA